MSEKDNIVFERRTPSKSGRDTENRVFNIEISKPNSNLQSNINSNAKPKDIANNPQINTINSGSQSSRPTTRGSINFAKGMRNGRQSIKKDQFQDINRFSALTIQPKVFNEEKGQNSQKPVIRENEHETSDNFITDHDYRNNMLELSSELPEQESQIPYNNEINYTKEHSVQNNNINEGLLSRKETHSSSKRILTRKTSQDSKAEIRHDSYGDQNRNLKLTKKVNFNKLNSIFQKDQPADEKEKVIAYEHFLRKSVLDRVFSMVPTLSKYNGTVNDKSEELTNRILDTRKLKTDSVPQFREFNEPTQNAIIDYKILKSTNKNVNDDDINSTKIIKWAKAISNRLDGYISKKDNKTQTLADDGEYICDELYKLGHLAKGKYITPGNLDDKNSNHLKTEDLRTRQKGNIMDNHYKKFRRGSKFLSDVGTHFAESKVINEKNNTKNLSNSRLFNNQDKSNEEKKIFESDIVALPKITPNNFIQKDSEIRKLVEAIDRFKVEKKESMESDMSAAQIKLKKMEKKFKSHSNKKSFENNSQLENTGRSMTNELANFYKKPRITKNKLRAISERLTQYKPMKIPGIPIKLGENLKKGFSSRIPGKQLQGSHSLANISASELSPLKNKSKHYLLTEFNEPSLKPREMTEPNSQKNLDDLDLRKIKNNILEEDDTNSLKDRKKSPYNKYYLPRVYSGHEVFNRNFDNKLYSLQKSYRKNNTYINDYLKTLDQSNSLVNKTSTPALNEPLTKRPEENSQPLSEQRDLSPGDTMVENLILKLKTKVKSQENSRDQNYHSRKFLSNHNLKSDLSYNPMIDTTKNTANYDYSTVKQGNFNQETSLESNKKLQSNQQSLQQNLKKNFFNFKSQNKPYINMDHTIDFKKKNDIVYSICTTNDNKQEHTNITGSILKYKDNQSKQSAEVKFADQESFEYHGKSQNDNSLINSDSRNKINENSDIQQEVIENSSQEKYSNSQILDGNKEDPALITFQKPFRPNSKIEKLHNKNNLNRLKDCCQEINSLKRNFGKIKRNDLSTLKSCAKNMKHISFKNDTINSVGPTRENMIELNKDLYDEREVFTERYISVFGGKKKSTSGHQLKGVKDVTVSKYKTYKFT